MKVLTVAGGSLTKFVDFSRQIVGRFQLAPDIFVRSVGLPAAGSSYFRLSKFPRVQCHHGWNPCSKGVTGELQVPVHSR